MFVAPVSCCIDTRASSCDDRVAIQEPAASLEPTGICFVLSCCRSGALLNRIERAPEVLPVRSVCRPVGNNDFTNEGVFPSRFSICLCVFYPIGTGNSYTVQSLRSGRPCDEYGQSSKRIKLSLLIGTRAAGYLYWKCLQLVRVGHTQTLQAARKGSLFFGNVKIRPPHSLAVP